MRQILATLLAGTLVSLASAQTVTFSLDSPQNGTTVAPGATINWTIAFTTSSGDNAGAALVTVDLAQSGTNPGFLDIPPATSVPAAMTNFSRPAGISNPGELNPATGYTGVQRGTPGRKNLVQVGGAQNTFGQTLPPATGAAQNAVVAGGVGQSGSVVLGTGSFAAPAANGTYTFVLQNAEANVLTVVNAPPAFSPTVSATPVLGTSSITFTVGAPPCVGDINHDGSVNLTDLAILLSQFGSTGTGLSADINGDNAVDLTDLATLLARFGTSC